MEDARIPSEIVDVLNIEFMGFKMWHLLLIALIIPSPVFLVVLFFIVPGFKDKVTELIRNGFSRVYPGTASGDGEAGQVSPEGNTPYPSEVGGPYRREGQGSFGEQQFQEAPEGLRQAESLSRIGSGCDNL